MGYDNLSNFYRTTFTLIHHHKWSLTEIENMIPWEKIVYIDMLKAHIKQQEEEARQKAIQQRAMNR